jgi:hypothetical protein
MAQHIISHHCQPDFVIAMRRLLLGTILVLLPLIGTALLIFLAVQMVQDIQAHADWEINLMRMICVVTVLLLAMPSVYKSYSRSMLV